MQHIESPGHRAFARQDENYRLLDRILIDSNLLL